MPWQVAFILPNLLDVHSTIDSFGVDEGAGRNRVDDALEVAGELPEGQELVFLAAVVVEELEELAGSISESPVAGADDRVEGFPCSLDTFLVVAVLHLGTRFQLPLGGLVEGCGLGLNSTSQGQVSDWLN